MSPNITEKLNGNKQNATQYNDQERQNIIYPVTDRINHDHANQIERIKQNLIHEKQIHAAEIERIKKIHAAEIERIKQIHAAEIERIKQIHAAEIERIKQELELVKSERDYYKDMVLKHIFNKN
jgi:hypothetical protein